MGKGKKMKTVTAIQQAKANAAGSAAGNDGSLMIYVLLASLLALLCVPQTAAAKQIVVDEASFAPTYQARDVRLSLNGAGLLRYLGIVKVYAGALYLPEGSDAQDVLDDIPKRLEVVFLRPVQAEVFSETTNAHMQENLDPGALEKIKNQIDAHNAIYTDMSFGDRCAWTYLPGIGTQMAINGELRATIPGAEFARALYAMWLGAQPLDKAFKASLLGQR